MAIDRETYCMDCERSIYGRLTSCDVNIENNGRYVMAGEECHCKVKKKPAEHFEETDRQQS